jgi:hypothetical protein
MMKTFVTLCVLALAIPVSAQTEQTDPYSINFVRTVLNLQGQGIHMSFVDKRIPQLGDETAIALLKIFTEAELSDPKIVATFLPVIQESFSQPQFIASDADKTPSVTLILLKYLQRNISDVPTQRSIEDTIKFVQGKTETPIGALYDQLLQPSETNSAAQQIHDLAAKDATARDYLAHKLPTMISANAKGDWQSVNLMWLNAVRLAGQLRLETAIPALLQSLLGRNQVPVWAYDKPGPVGASTFSRDARLENDIVARALADIGDPAVPAVAYVLANGDTRILRLRAAWVLINIDTPAARKAMSDVLKVETDPGIRQLLDKHQ